MSKPRLLWIGDAGVESGFGRVTHEVLRTVIETWDVSVLGLNYRGDPHTQPFPIFPCNKRDVWGRDRIKELVESRKIDVVCIQNDPWNIKEYAKEVPEGIGLVAVMPVDGKNVAGEELIGLDHAIWWTDFAKREAEQGGYVGKNSVIPLGVDLTKYFPQDRIFARRRLKLPEMLDNAFIVGNVNRNQPRKRLDLMISYFFDWVNRDQIEDAYIYLHICPTGDSGYGLVRLIDYFHGHGKPARAILVQPEIGQGDPEERLALTYSAFDVQATTTQGEGWGLTTLEGMACGIPQIVPDWSALGEWTIGAAYQVATGEISVTPGGIDIVGAIPDRECFIEGLRTMYQFKDERAEYSKLGIALANDSQFRWKNIANKYLEVFNQVLSEIQMKEQSHGVHVLQVN